MIMIWVMSITKLIFAQVACFVILLVACYHAPVILPPKPEPCPKVDSLKLAGEYSIAYIWDKVRQDSLLPQPEDAQAWVNLTLEAIPDRPGFYRAHASAMNAFQGAYTLGPNNTIDLKLYQLTLVEGSAWDKGIFIRPPRGRIGTDSNFFLQIFDPFRVMKYICVISAL